MAEYIHDDAAFTYDHDLKIAKAMTQYGGSFVKALAYAWLCGDDQNRAKIKETWPEYWAKYENFLE